MLGGQQVLSLLYPGFTDRLQRLGAVRFRFGIEAAFFFPGGRSYTPTGSVRQARDLGIDGYSQSRGLLEHCVRQCTLELANLTFVGDAAVQGLIYENGQVRGVSVDSRRCCGVDFCRPRDRRRRPRLARPSMAH